MRFIQDMTKSPRPFRTGGRTVRKAVIAHAKQPKVTQPVTHQAAAVAAGKAKAKRHQKPEAAVEGKVAMPRLDRPRRRQHFDDGGMVLNVDSLPPLVQARNGIPSAPPSARGSFGPSTPPAIPQQADPIRQAFSAVEGINAMRDLLNPKDEQKERRGGRVRHK
jgi:hypothetical protein